MNTLHHLFGRRVGALCVLTAEIAPRPKRNATMQGLTPLLMFVLLAIAVPAQGQYSINFDGAGDDTSASTYGFTGKNWNGITWSGDQSIVPTTPLTADWYNGTRSLRMRGYSTSHATMTADKTNGAGTISFDYRRYGTDAQVTYRVEYSTNGGSSWTQAGSDFTAPANDTVQTFSATINVTGNVRIRIVHASGGASSNKRLNIDDITITDYAAATPSIAIADNGTVGTANVAAGTAAHVLIKFSAAVTVANATLNTVAFTTGGTYDSNDLTNLKLWYSTDSTLDTGSDTTIGTITSPAAAGAKSFTGLTQAINSGNTGYFFITMDVASGATGGNTVSISAIANADLTFAAGTKSGSVLAGGAQTITSSTGDIWINPMSAGTPMATYYLGDTMGSWNVNFEIGQTTWDSARVGIGTATDGTGYNWGTANWYEDGSGSNKRVRRDLSGYQYTETGSHYVICQARNNSANPYVSKSGNGWSNLVVYPPADLSSAYFTCSALGNPTGVSAAKDGTHPATRMDLSWTQWSGRNVLITRSTAAPSGAPTQGTAYSAGNTFGNQTVVSGSQGGTSLEVTGLTPGETYYFTFYSENYSYYSPGATDQEATASAATVSTTSADPSTPADPTQANATGNVTADNGSAVTERGIVWNTSGTPTTGDNKVAHGSGGTGSFTVTLTGLTPGQTIYYRAYATNAIGLSYGSTETFSADCFTNGPGVLAATSIGSTNFTANWEAVTGATSYRLDVSEESTFQTGGASGGLFISEVTDPSDVANAKYVELYNASGAAIDFGSEIWYLSRQANGAGALANVQLTGTLADGGTYVIAYNTTFDSSYSDTADMYNGTVISGNGDDSYWLIQGGGYGTGTVVDAYGVMNQDGTGMAWEYTDSKAVRNSSISTGTDTWTASEWTITGAAVSGMTPHSHTCSGGSTPSYVGGFENLTVAGTSQLVTGLTVGVTYYYRARAVNAYCTSVNSATQDVTTVAAVPSIAIADNGTQVGVANVATGTLAHVLSKFSAAVTVADATLNEVAFTTGGTYDADDLSNLKLWHSTDATLNTGSDTLLDTIATPAAAGAKSFTGLTQLIGMGSTGYFFITADVAPGATYGNTVSVGAIANSALTFASGNKSGSVTAGGAQTFIATAPTTHASGMSFSSVMASQMGVSWTSGNGERRIVVVREGSATSWTPSDGTAPSGVSASYSSATDQGSGNKICYDGTGSGFTLSGLNPNTTYHLTVFEYNGTTTHVKYYTGGTPLAGSRLTADAPPARWTALYNRGAPIASYYLGDLLPYVFEFAINTDTTAWTIDYGVGQSTVGTGWTWRSAEWSRMDGAVNRVWKSKADEHRFTATGDWYYAGRMTTNSYTYFVDGDWVSDLGESLSASSYFTVSALTAPSTPAAAKDATHPATRVDLSWAQWNSKNVLITRSTAAPSGSPSQGTAYVAGNTFGNQTVVSGSQGGTSLEVTGLTPGATYYFTFYSENYSYYSAAATATAVTLDRPQARNTGGNATPGAPAGTVYLGDVKTFTLDSWGNVEGDWGRARLWTRQGDADLSGGASGAWTDYVNQDTKTTTSGVFGATGTWYWGVQMDYGATFGDAYYYKASSATWANLAADGTGSTLSFTVEAINDPSGQGATPDAASGGSEIDLSWTKNAQGHNVMVVRKPTAGAWTEPTQGTGYAATDALGDGTVIYNGAATSFDDTGLSGATTYDYKFYSVNNNYYSTGVTTQGTTLSAEPGASPNTLAFTDVTGVGMTISWAGVSSQVLVVLRAGSDLSADPADGTTYTADADFGGAGTALGGGKVVYKGSGTSVAVSGLSGGTVYYVRVYNYNGSGGTENYRTSDELNGSQLTCPEAPAILSETNVTSTAFYANWSAATGATGYRLDVMTALGGAGTTSYLSEDFEGGSISGWTESTASRWGASTTTPLNGSYSLKHTYSTASAGEDRISIPLTGLDLTTATTTWRMQVRHGMNPSANNSWAVFLSSDGAASQMHSSGTANGYIVGVNYTGSDDTLRVWRVTSGAATVVLASGLNWESTIGTSGKCGIEVTRSAAGEWSLKLDTNGGFDNLVASGTPATDTTHLDADYFGADFKYTSTGDMLFWLDDVDIEQAGGLPTYLTGYENLDVGNVTTYAVTGLDPLTDYWYRVRAVGSTCTSSNSAVEAVQTVGSSALVAIDDTGMPVAGFRAAGLTDAVVFGFRLSITLDTVNFTGLTLDTAGTATSSDVSNFRLAYDADNSGTYNAGDSIVSTAAQALGDPISFGITGQTGLSGNRRYLVIADFAANATAGRTLTCAIADAGDVTTTGTESGTAAGTLQTISGTCAIDNTGAPGTGGHETGKADAVLFGFRLTPSGTISFTGLSLDTAGTATSSDLSNFEVVYDADNSGTYNVGDSIVSTAAQALGDPIVFTISGQTFSAARRYLVIADVAGGATVGRTITCNIAAASAVTTTGTESGTATGNQQTIVTASPTTHASGLSFTAVGTSQMTVNWTSGDGANRIVVVREGTATSWAPTDGVAPTGVDASFTGATDQGSGNKICYNGAGTSFTLTGLTAGNTYHVTIYEYNGSGAYVNYYLEGTPLAGSQATDCPSAPAALWASATNALDFTAEWSASADAAGYVIDVSTIPTFGGAGTIMFQGFEGAAGDTWGCTSNGTVTVSTNHRTGAYSIRLAGTTVSSVMFEPVALAGINATTVTVAFSSSGTASGEDLFMCVYSRTAGVLSSNVTKLIDGYGGTAIAFDATNASDPTTVSPNPYQVAIPAAATQVYFSVYTSSGLEASDYFFIDDVSLTGDVGSYVPGYEKLPVAGTSVAVTGLSENVTYYFRVAAAGGTCMSSFTATEIVTTIGAPVVSVSPLSLDFGTVTMTAWADRTVSVENLGSQPLTISSVDFTGTGAGHFSVIAPASMPMTVLPGTTSNMTVRFEPTAGGTFNVTMTLNNNSANDGTVDVAIVGIGDDPTTEPPRFYAFRATDALAIERESTDHALANGGTTLGFTLWHFMGMEEAGASYDLIAPDGTVVWTNGAFDSMTPTTVGTLDCYRYDATVPNIYPATLGIYTARVTAVSSNGYWITDEAAYTPFTAGQAAKKSLDDFGRANADNDIGNGWTANVVGPTNGNIRIVDEYLQFYGPGGSGGTNGRLSVVREISTNRYQTVLTNNASTLAWGFNFLPGYNLASGNLNGGSYCGAFVLGSDSTNWVQGAGSGYAVLIRSNRVSLAKFTGGLDANTDVTLFGTGTNISATTAISVRVALDPTTMEWTLFVKQLGGSTPGDFTDPLDGMSGYLVGSVVDSTYAASNLKYVGCYWNHGSAAVANGTRAVFDNLYAPYIVPNYEQANFEVYDEDLAAPVHEGFNVDGAIFDYTTLGAGLTVTGVVTDANGVFAGTSNTWTLTSNGTTIASGSMTMAPNVSGSTPAALSTTIAQSVLDDNASVLWRFTVVSRDYDVDRPGDTLATTNTYSFYITPAAPNGPINLVATADGAEMILMTWDINGAPDAMLIRDSKPITVGPTPGTAYSMHDEMTSGGARVVYLGGGERLKMVVPEGSTNYFRLYGMDGDLYSTTYATPAGQPIVTLEYEDGEITDQFAYTNGFTLAQNGLATGQGWDGGWTGTGTSVLTIDETNLLHGATDYPDPYANKLQWVANSPVICSVETVRKLTTPRSGRTFVAFMMNYKTRDNSLDLGNKYVGLSMMSGTDATTEQLFFGKLHAQNKLAGINYAAGGDVQTASSYVLNGQHFSDYMIVGELDRLSNQVKMWAFYQGDATPIPQEYTNATPIAVYSNAAVGTIPHITGVRLAAGMTADDVNSLDHVYFDEVRVGGTWDEVLNFNYPKAYDFMAGYKGPDGTNYISDGELAEPGKSYPVSYTLFHRSGVTNAQFTIITNVNTYGGLYPTNVQLKLDPSDALAKTRAFTNLVTNRLDPSVVSLGVFTSRVWMTSVSGKATNTLFMEGQAGATDLFFGEFGEGNNYDKYVEIYNSSGGAIDLSQYVIANQMNPTGAETNDYTIKGWGNFCRLAATPTWLAHGDTILILNGAPSGKIDPSMTNALATAVPPRAYLITTNEALTVGGDDPVALFRADNTNEWIDACGIGPAAARYIMRRLEDAEVPRSFPLTVDPSQWDYRDWESDRPTGYTNFLTTAGVYDRQVGVGGFTTFTVFDDDEDLPVIGTDSAVMIGSSAPYTMLTKTQGQSEVVISAWSFTNATVAEALKPYHLSLVTNATITWTADYTNEMVDLDGGTKENSWFGSYDQYAKGELDMRGVGNAVYGFDSTPAWIQFELNLVAADEIAFSWAEQGGSYTFNSAQAQWSLDGITFATNALWPPWDPDTGGAWSSRLLEFAGVVPAGIPRVYLRIVLGPGVGGSSGYYRMDNVQLTGYPEEYVVTDGQLADSGGVLRFKGNLYDTNSGISAASSSLSIKGTALPRDTGWTGLGTGRTNGSSLKWDWTLTASDITDLVLESQAGDGLPIRVGVADADADRPGDEISLDGQLGGLRVEDDDDAVPRLTLATMRPKSGVLAQWRFTNAYSKLPTKLDGGVDGTEMQTETVAGTVSIPRWVQKDTDQWALQQSGWQFTTKYWHVEITPETDMVITNITLQSRVSTVFGPSSYRVEKWVGGAMIWQSDLTYFTGDPGTPVNTSTWYTTTHNLGAATLTLDHDVETQIRFHAYGCNKAYIGAKWAVYDLTFRHGGGSSLGVTEVTDKEFSEGTFQLEGATWDAGSGLKGPAHADASKRPRFSLNRPDSTTLVVDQPLGFSAAVADGGATTEVAGAFTNSLPVPVYTNLLMGEYAGHVAVWDNDGDRTQDDLRTDADIAMYVVDNDVEPPSDVGNVFVNGVAVPGAAPDRWSVDWTNRPEFLITFDALAEDQDPGASYQANQRALTGIGEYRVTTDAGANALAASNRAAIGRPYPVATTNGALANYGFEMPGAGWTIDANCAYQSLAVVGTNFVKEGTNSLMQHDHGVAYQYVEFANGAAATPTIGVRGWYKSNHGAEFRIEALATTNPATLVATRSLTLGAAANWTQFAIDPVEPLGNGTVGVLKISLIDGGENTTYWDAIRFSVDIGANDAAMRFVAAPENQGLNPQYLFAVDADNNRSGDRLAGAAKPFYVAYDATPPTPVPLPANGASTDEVGDPSTQFDVTWDASAAGPDDPGHGNHPTGVGNDLFSPWKTYKIYYGTYNSLTIPSGDPGHGDPAAFVYTNFVATGAYTNWPYVTSTNDIDDPSVMGTTNYLALTNAGQNKIRLFDLEFDQEYALVVVGVDAAGNEGLPGTTSWATNDTIKFSVTSGFVMAKSRARSIFGAGVATNVPAASNTAALGWIAAGQRDGTGMVTRAYDLISWDSGSFVESTNNNWKLVSTVKSNWFVDDGGQFRPRGQMRFYRAAYSNRWRKVSQFGQPQRPMASEEIYALHNVVLSEGYNYVALHGVPYYNTFAGVFGTDTNVWPGASVPTDATRVELYTPGTTAVVYETYWFGADGEWRNSGGVVTHVEQAPGFFSRGFSITLPKPLPEFYRTHWAQDSAQPGTNVAAMVWSPVMQVPTNGPNGGGFSHVITAGGRDPRGRVTNSYNLVSLCLPVAAHPFSMNLLESGFVPAEPGRPSTGDQIYTVNNSAKDVASAATIYFDAGATNGLPAYEHWRGWKFLSTGGEVGWGHFRPNDVVVIVSRNQKPGGTWTWTYHPTNFYKLPTRWMEPAN